MAHVPHIDDKDKYDDYKKDKPGYVSKNDPVKVKQEANKAKSKK